MLSFREADILDKFDAGIGTIWIGVDPRHITDEKDGDERIMLYSRPIIIEPSEPTKDEQLMDIFDAVNRAEGETFSKDPIYVGYKQMDLTDDGRRIERMTEVTNRFHPSHLARIKSVALRALAEIGTMALEDGVDLHRMAVFIKYKKTWGKKSSLSFRNADILDRYEDPPLDIVEYEKYNADLVRRLNKKLEPMGMSVMYDYSCYRWDKDGVGLHRENDLPAMVLPNGDQTWYWNGKKHRENGAAQIYADGRRYWYLGGEIEISTRYDNTPMSERIALRPQAGR